MKCRPHDSMINHSSGIPSSFDPRLLDSEYDHIQNAPNSLSHSDDLEALQACVAEDTVQKNKKGVVIQHRAWNTADIFRSDTEHPIGTARANNHCYQY